MSKIIICGLNGSGKSTLGKALSEKINYIHKDIESYYFEDKGNYKYAKSRTKVDVTKSLEKDFENYQNIIFSACKGDYGNLNNSYDLAIYIKLDKETRLERVKQRSYKQFGNRALEGGDLYEQEMRFFEKVYKKDESEILDWFNDLKCSKIVVDGRNTVEENINSILKANKDAIWYNVKK